MTIRVILADAHRILLDTLSLFLENMGDIKVVGATTDGRLVQQLAVSLLPDVVVMDIGMPGMNSVEATRQLIAAHPQISVIALSDCDHKQHVQKMLEAGASARIIKENAASELVRALHSVTRSKKYLPQKVAKMMAENTGHYTMDSVPQLGRREREVLQLLAKGCTSPAIAKRMFISAGTVEVHRRNIRRKLDLHNTAELTKYAVRHGLTSA